MPLSTCFDCGLAFSAVESSCPHCRLRTKGGVVSFQKPLVDSRPGRHVSAIMSLVVPGTGQIFREKSAQGLVWFAAAAAGYLTSIPLGMLVHGLCVWHAASAD